MSVSCTNLYNSQHKYFCPFVFPEQPSPTPSVTGMAMAGRGYNKNIKTPKCRFSSGAKIRVSRVTPGLTH